MKIENGPFRFLAVAGFVAATIFVAGCNRSPNPDTIAAGGIVTLNGAPINNVEVRFIPTQEGLDGNFIATGVSDDEGRFVLKFRGGTESQVCVGENRVIIAEGPMPEGARGQSEEGQKEALKFTRSLKYRPLPKKYKSLSESDLIVTVVEGTTEYAIELQR